MFVGGDEQSDHELRLPQCEGAWACRDPHGCDSRHGRVRLQGGKKALLWSAPVETPPERERPLASPQLLFGCWSSARMQDPRRPCCEPARLCLSSRCIFWDSATAVFGITASRRTARSS